MMCTLLRGSVVVLGALVMGCAQEEADVVGHAAQPVVETNAPAAQAEVRDVEAPALAEYRALSSVPVFEMRSALAWTREERGGFEVFSAPGGQVKVLTTPFGDKDEMVARRDAALALVEGSAVRPAEQRKVRMGDAQLDAVAEDGVMKVPSGDAGFQCAVVTERTGRKVFVAYVFRKDAPESMRADGMRMIATLRDKK